MAGVTREAKAAQERLPDRISIGVLTRAFPAPLLDDVIRAAGVREARHRRLPARLMMVFTLACWLFMRSGYGIVLSKLADAQALNGEGWGDGQTPWTGSIAKAKARLGAAPFKLLFTRTAVPIGTASTPGAFYAGLRVVSMDGFTLALPPSNDNAEFFGPPPNRNGCPQLRALALAESVSRVLLAATYGPGGSSEPALAEHLLPALGPGMLVVADGGLVSWQLWRAAVATGAQLCWRVPAPSGLPVLEVLPDGTFVSELRPPRAGDGPPIRVRAMEYDLRTDGDGHALPEGISLVTTLMDGRAYPAIDLARLYHSRWQAGPGLGDLTAALRGEPEVMLRSRTPAMVEQEFWAMLCVYQAIRELIGYPAPATLACERMSLLGPNLKSA